MAAATEEQIGLMFLSTDDLAVTGAYDIPDNMRVTSIDWASDTQAIVTVGVMGREDKRFVSSGNLYLAHADGRAFYRVFSGRQDRVPWGRTLAGPRSAGVARFISRLRHDPDHVLVEVNRESWRHQSSHGSKIYQMNLTTGERELFADGPGYEWASFASDPDGAWLIGRVTQDHRATQYYRYDLRNERWAEVGNPMDVFESWRPFSVMVRGESFVLPTLNSKGQRCLARYRSQVSAPDALIACAKRQDVAGIVTSFDGSTAVAVRLDGSRPALQFLGTDHPDEARLRVIHETFQAAGQFVTPTSSSDDGYLVLLSASSDRHPTDYYLYDTQAHRARFLLSTREWIAPEEMATQQVIQVTARDGYTFEAIYARPSQAAQGALPLVVMPHGGPFAVHDQRGWDARVQALASRGYAVLQPNFRGSGGYGHEHLEAGRHELGGVMIQDIIDATKQLIANGHADERVCIVGGSYGGFAAVSAAAQAPTLFRCVVTQAGLYDLNRTYHEAWLDRRAWQKKWLKQYYGGRSTRKKQSPGRVIEQIAAPVLVLHGDKDSVVPIDHAEALVNDLERQGKQVTVHYFDGEGHSFTSLHNRVRVLELIDSFLEQHLVGSTSVDVSED